MPGNHLVIGSPCVVGSSTDDRELWLYQQFDDRKLERCRALLRDIPAVDDIRVACFIDPASAISMLRLRFRGSRRDEERLRGWAKEAQINVIDMAGWTQAKRDRFGQGVARFQCRTASSDVYGFALQLASAATTALMKRERARSAPLEEQGVPSTIVVSDTLRNEATRWPRSTASLRSVSQESVVGEINTNNDPWSDEHSAVFAGGDSGEFSGIYWR